VLTKLTGADVKLSVRVEATQAGGIPAGRVDEFKQALLELGLGARLSSVDESAYPRLKASLSDLP